MFNMSFTLEKKATYKGYVYYVIGTEMGHRCGYVCIFQDHPLFKTDYSAIDVDVHGGLTFSGENYFINTKTKSWLIGFDCAHDGDKKDYSLMDPKPAEIYRNIILNEGHVWTTEDVEQECKTLIDQIIEKYD